MSVPKKGRSLRIGLTAALCGMLVCVCVLLFTTPSLGRFELIPPDGRISGNMTLLPEETLVQSAYSYREFDHLKLFRDNAGAEQTCGLEILEEGESLFTGEASFATGKTELEIPVSGRKGSLLLRLTNRGGESLVLPTVWDDYDPEMLTVGDKPLLRIGLSRESNRARWMLTAVALILFFLSLTVLWRWGHRWNRKKALLFLWVFSLAFLLLFPAWNVNDFSAHYSTAYAHASAFMKVQTHDYGDLVVREDDNFYFRYVVENHGRLYQPSVRSYDDSLEYLFRPSLQNDPVPSGFAHRILNYGFWNYLPYILSIMVSRWLSLNLVTSVFLGRLFGISFFLTGIYFSMKKLPSRALLPVTLISCVPLSAMNLTAVSYDALCYVVVLNLFSCILSLRERYRLRSALSLLITCLFLGLVKGGAYSIFGLSLLLLLSEKNRKQIWPFIFSISALLLGLAFNFRSILEQDGLAQFGGEDTGDYYAAWALSHPLDYLLMAVRTYFREPEKIFDVLGHRLGWNSPTLPEVLCALIYVLLIFSVLSSSPEAGEPYRPFSRFEKTWLWLPMALLLILTPVMLLSETPRTMITVEGVQGRYFLPLLIPAALLGLYRAQKKAEPGGGDPSLLLGGFGLLSLSSVYYFVLHFLCT